MDARRVVERYLDSWNQADGDARRAAIAELWSTDGTYVDPLADVVGHDGLASLIEAIQQQLPGHVFRLVDGSVDAHHNVMRFGWELVPTEGGEPVAVGFDVAVTGAEGRIENVIGFLDKAPAA